MKIRVANEFKRDLKKVKKRGKDINRLNEIVKKICSNVKLEQKYRAHKLRGNYQDKMECHIEPDWLLIYEFDGQYVILYRTGSHSDLFE